MNYLQQLKDICEKHGFTLHLSDHCTCVNVSRDYDNFIMTSAAASRDDNVLTALAWAMDVAEQWPAVLLTNHSKGIRTWDLQAALPRYTGMVRVYSQGLPPATWLAKQGALVWQF